MLRTIYQTVRSLWGASLFAAAVGATLVVSTGQQALAQSGSIYPGGAADVPEWLLEGKAAPDRYLALQAQLDARTARIQLLAARPDGWRYVRDGGRWWYYQSNQRWLVYENNAWKPYMTPASATQHSDHATVADTAKPANDSAVGK
jgi:hypothetical protein